MLIRADLDHSISFQKSWQEQLSWRQIKRNWAVPNVFETKPRLQRQQCSPKKQSTHILLPPLRFSSPLHVSPNKGVKMKTQQTIFKNMAQDMSIYGMMFRKRSHVSTKFTQMTYVKSSDLIKPPEEFFLKTSPANSTLPTPGGHKSTSHWDIYLSEAVTCRAVFRRHEGTVDTEAAAAVVAAEDVHSIGHVAPYRCVAIARCGRRSARGQLTPAIGLAKVAQMFWSYKETLLRNRCRKSNHDAHSTKIELASWPLGHLAVICPSSSLSSLRCI